MESSIVVMRRVMKKVGIGPKTKRVIPEGHRPGIKGLKGLWGGSRQYGEASTSHSTTSG